MKEEKETREKLLKSAKEEFAEKGYLRASLRTICKNAGVTTGALYFFFKDKEDLFAEIVEGPFFHLLEMIEQHYERERIETVEQGGQKKDFTDDMQVAKMAIHYLYEYYEEFQMLLTKAQGSRFENCVDQMIALTERQYRHLADEYTSMQKIEPLDDYMIHWIAHMHMDAFVHMLTHETSEKAALKHIEEIIKYLIAGWSGMFS